VLDPPYQRNFIWSIKDQKELIDSILNNHPLPNFFLRSLKNGKYEMVDGQQRTRTILSYYRNNFAINDVNQDLKKSFNDYVISVTVISEIGKDELIEDFYARVNRTGLKTNKPELNKAQYFYTVFLGLNEELANNAQFRVLDLFTDASTKRMNDIDLVSELVTLLEFGNFEKKIKVDDLYESDISEQKRKELKDKFLLVVDRIAKLNSLSPLKKSRYRQRNDFFHFVRIYIKSQRSYRSSTGILF